MTGPSLLEAALIGYLAQLGEIEARMIALRKQIRERSFLGSGLTKRGGIA